MEELIKACIFRLEENLVRIQTCLSHLNHDELWFRPNENSNSIGNLILHLNGNIGQYIISCLGNKADHRQRDLEFDANHQISKAELYGRHETVITDAIQIIKKLPESALKQRFRVQGFEMNGTDILIHVTEHYSYHTGQIALLVKLQKNLDLGFYKGVDLNRKNYK